MSTSALVAEVVTSFKANGLKLNGEEALMYDPNPDDSHRQRVLRAAASCPVQAILVDFNDKAKGTSS